MLHVMPRLTHHNSAQHMMTGAMMSSDGKLLSGGEQAVLMVS